MVVEVDLGIWGVQPHVGSPCARADAGILPGPAARRVCLQVLADHHRQPQRLLRRVGRAAAGLRMAAKGVRSGGKVTAELL